MQTEVSTDPRPRLLFVDDEQRVLNSMRIMFRRQFDLFLASHGAEALKIIESENIDVIVADHRMPKMTGVEVLTQVRHMSPRTVRILLTGYADLDAVEGSINDSEVFRFLTKPCAPQHLRDTVELAAKLSRTAAEPSESDEDDDIFEIILESDTVTEVDRSTRADRDTITIPTLSASLVPDDTSNKLGVPAAELLADTHTDISHAATTVIGHPVLAGDEARSTATSDTASRKAPSGLGIIVFSSDDQMLTTVQQAVRGRVPVYSASNVVKVVHLLTEHKPGVLITDVSDDKNAIQSMTARLKEHLPQLVTVAVSPHRDVLDMIWLINHGQIFRFLRKPLSTGRCAVSLQAALQHHRLLLKNPDLCQRHSVESAKDAGLVDGFLSRIKNVKRLWTLQ